MTPDSRFGRLVPVLLVSALVVTAALVWTQERNQRFSATFASARMLHVGDEVRVLDVPVGEVTEITPREDGVLVEMSVDEDRPVPDDARATLVAPSMVSVRHVALSPVYDGGPRLRSGAHIGQQRTAVPVEWDEMKAQLTELSRALGPQGANRHGAVDRLVSAGADNLRGRGGQMSRTVRALSRAMASMSGNKEELFGTIRNLDTLTGVLARSDGSLRRLVRNLELVSGQLSRDRDQLVEALAAVTRAMRHLDGLLEENAGRTTRTVKELRELTRALASRRQGLADILQSAPTAMSNYYNIFSADSHAMTGVFVGNNFDSPAVFICSTLYSLGGTPQECKDLLRPVAKYLVNKDGLPVGVSPVNKNRDTYEQGDGRGGSR